jgi:phage terminase large subunit-like protein
MSDAPTLYRSLADALQRATDGDWRTIARPSQLPPPGKWTVWVFQGGRGTGKTRAGSEWVCDRVRRGVGRRIALIGPTAADVRDVMVEGESGILAVSPAWDRPIYEPSKRRVTWSNGAVASLFSADEPDRLRGPQHDTGWFDELVVGRFAAAAWDTFSFGLRVGKNPQACVTTTPKPVRVLRELLARVGQGVVVTKDTTYANRGNLAPEFFESIIRRYEGTRLGRQELDAELLEDVPGALWQRDKIDETRMTVSPFLSRIVVAIDPAATSGPDADESGIIVAGVGPDGDGYVIEDLSGRYPPTDWAKIAIDAYHRYRADRIVAEVNNGGEMVEHVLRMIDPAVAYKPVHASRGKIIRAEPVAALYEQSRVHHVGSFAQLEDQMCSFSADADRSRGASPDRVDALVWALSELIVSSHEVPEVSDALLAWSRGEDWLTPPTTPSWVTEPSQAEINDWNRRAVFVPSRNASDFWRRWKT